MARIQRIVFPHALGYLPAQSVDTSTNDPTEWVANLVGNWWASRQPFADDTMRAAAFLQAKNVTAWSVRFASALATPAIATKGFKKSKGTAELVGWLVLGFAYPFLGLPASLVSASMR